MSARRAAALAVGGWLALLALGACDALLGIHEHELAAEADAAGDAAQESISPADAPPMDAAVDTTLDGPGGCVLGGQAIPNRALDPNNSCLNCQTAVSSTTWTPLADGTTCGDGGGVCKGAACVSGCEIDSVFYSTFALNPANVCESCQPATSVTAWTPVKDGAGCSGGACCAGACVDEQTSAGNCGGCGVVCGGTCALSRCLVTIASNLDRPQFVLLSGNEVYWNNHVSAGSLESVGLDGGTPRTLASSQDYPGRLAAAPNYLYWSNYDSPGGSVVQVSIDGGVLFTLATAQSFPSGLAWTPTGLYWGEQGSDAGGLIRYLPFDGGKAGTIASGQADPAGLAADGHDVYWANENLDSGIGSVVRAPLGGGPATTLAKALGDAANVAIDEEYLYWTEQHEGVVMRVPVGGGAAQTLVTAQHGPTGIAVEGGVVYWTNYAGNTVMSYTLQGGAITTVAAGLNQPNAVAVGATSLYFCETANPGDVIKVTPK